MSKRYFFNKIFNLIFKWMSKNKQIKPFRCDIQVNNNYSFNLIKAIALSIEAKKL